MLSGLSASIAAVLDPSLAVLHLGDCSLSVTAGQLAVNASCPTVRELALQSEVTALKVQMAQLQADAPSTSLFAGMHASGKTCADIWHKGEDHGPGFYYVDPKGTSDLIRVWCDSGQTLLVKYRDGNSAYHFDDDGALTKLSNPQLWALLRESTSIVRKILRQDYVLLPTMPWWWAEQSWPLSKGMTSAGRTLYQGNWFGHDNRKPPRLDDVSGSIVFGQLAYGSGYSYHQIGTTMYTLPPEITELTGSSNGNFNTFELWAGDAVTSAQPRRTCADVKTAGDSDGGLYDVVPDGHDPVRVYCKDGQTLLAKATSGSRTYIGDSGIKLTNLQMWTLLNASSSIVRVVTHSSKDYSQAFELTNGMVGPTAPDRYTLFWGSWNGHSTAPTMDDSHSSLVFGEIEAGSNYNYPQIGNTMYSLPSELQAVVGVGHGSFSTYEFWAA